MEGRGLKIEDRMQRSIGWRIENHGLRRINRLSPTWTRSSILNLRSSLDSFGRRAQSKGCIQGKHSGAGSHGVVVEGCGERDHQLSEAARSHNENPSPIRDDELVGKASE